MATRRVRGAVRESAAEKNAKERTRIHERTRDDLSKRHISNAENLDKSVLTYSGAGLALSLGFLKDFIPIREAKLPWALYGSWVAFTVAMVLVVVSYVVSQWVIELQLDRAHRYYEERDEAAYDETAVVEVIANHLNGWIYAAAFAIGLSLTILFVSVNLSGANMVNKSDKTGSWAFAQDGAIGTKMQRIERGVTGGKMQPVKSNTPAQPASQPRPSGTPTKTK
ncbi:hypothetical protein [Burkholderia pseudomallei]|uniref:hypothetical protein n=1 Tax=Burkholderia pseudomallei TaxID=28450 RepID=UPI0009B1CF64|nr:hypothetical protein [Burkholderia pseudomallei]